MNFRDRFHDRIHRLQHAFIITASLILAYSVHASTFYVAPDGADTNNGTIEGPFASVQRAQTAASAGDTVYIRGGTYHMTEAQIATKSSIFAYVTNLTKSGSSSNGRINYWSYPNERPVFDLSNVKPSGYRVIAFNVSGSYIHLRGIEVIGVQVTITTHTQSECFENTGNNNIYEQLLMHDGMAIGYYQTRGSNNLVLNCDAYRNWDSVSEGGVGGNVDGFGGHPNRTSYTGNVFRGCRAWFNSDDGYDSINAYQTITFENCWAFFNGYTSSFVSKGDGNGFKSGGYGAAGGTVPSPIPRHLTRNCLAVRNKANGIYSNHHVGGSDWISNTAFQNATNYNMLSTLADNDTDVAGYDHFMRNNLSYSPRGTSLSNLDQTASDVSSNFFTLPVTVSSSDFEETTTSTSELEQFVTQPRKANGELPDIALLHLATGSDLIDSGSHTGSPFMGAAPDLGTFESGATSNSRTLTWKGDNTSNVWDLNLTSNWLFGSEITKFGPTDHLIFDDNGSSSPSLTLNGNLWPGSVKITGSKNYTFAGNGTLGGAMNLTMAGSGTFTLAGILTYSGSTTISSGRLILVGALSNNAPIVVESGACLQVASTSTSGQLQNNGLVEVTAGNLTINGDVANSGNLVVTHGATLSVTGIFTNEGVLDLRESSSAVPANLVNHGTVLTKPTFATITDFSTFLQNQFPGVSSPSVTGALSNPDGDSWSNLIEYFLGLNPNLGDGADAIYTSLNAAGDPELVFRMAKNLSGVSYKVQKSTTLSSWDDTGLIPTAEDLGSHYRMHILVPHENLPKLFLRLNVTLSP